MTEDQIVKKINLWKHNLFEAKLKTHKKIENMGWGSGMRKTRIFPSRQREQYCEKKIEEYELLLKSLEENSETLPIK